MLNFTNEALHIAPIFRQKSSLEKDTFKINEELSQLKKIYDEYNLKYENIEELSIIDEKSEPIFRKELKHIENLLIEITEHKLLKKEENELVLKEKLEIINQNLNEIAHRQDEKNSLFILRNMAFENFKLKENELF